jgi:hypothetical protein
MRKIIITTKSTGGLARNAQSHEALTPADQVQDSVTVASTANTTITDPQGDKEAVGKTAD